MGGVDNCALDDWGLLFPPVRTDSLCSDLHMLAKEEVKVQKTGKAARDAYAQVASSKVDYGTQSPPVFPYEYASNPPSLRNSPDFNAHRVTSEQQQHLPESAQYYQYQEQQ
eukprot:CAMPEP_0174258208 /NCGR_PEP_ID=MMETSP0439-20130205/7251_1 /TAXON_ID=0 /ORGANISM="Stereomyxa ramosa, Strain Chinc5" /LENGTH=110 /DNA_ID=CAMNT_0015341635 /DNA_START=282 /DNA_END=615 /DNA_ORIENTATION=-